MLAWSQTGCVQPECEEGVRRARRGCGGERGRGYATLAEAHPQHRGAWTNAEEKIGAPHAHSFLRFILQDAQSDETRALLRHGGALGAIVRSPRRVSDVAFSSA